MKKPIPILLLIILALFISSCSRDNDIIQQPGTPVVIETPLLTHSDSLSAIAHLWQTVRDSLSSGGNYFWIENGGMHFPTPGVYIGNSDDSYHFKSNDSLLIHHQGYIFNIIWTFSQPRIINISEMNVHGPANIFKLTTTQLVLNWINTSSNGGTYYRRLYLKR